MLPLPSLGEMDRTLSVWVYLAVGSTDMRKGFDSLAALVRDHMKHDPLSGALFLFVGRNKDRLKILLWEKDGFVLWYKRLEEGVFKLPRIDDNATSVELRASELAMMLDGIDLRSIKRAKRFGVPQKNLAGRE